MAITRWDPTGSTFPALLAVSGGRHAEHLVEVPRGSTSKPPEIAIATP
jgi:hypothetical protein